MELDYIVDNGNGVMNQKQKMYDDLLQKNNMLKGHNREIAISYSIDLDYHYQRTLSNDMLFRLYMDLNKKSTVYKDDNESNEPSL